ncbi:MAG: glycosyltransferase family 61 protein [Paracoccus sp. (in: a-proteobacteria)]
MTLHNARTVPVPVRVPHPEPENGWSRSVLRLRDVVVDPEHGGVWTEDGLCPEAMLYRWSGTYRGWRGTRPENPQRLAGRHLWGGTIFFHFGHFLSESLSRLWAAQSSGAASILFTPKNMKGKRPEDLVGYQKQVLASLGINLPVRICYEPLEIEELIIPGQGFGLGRMSTGTPEFRDFARQMDPGAGADAEQAARPARKIYISRSALPKKTGSILGEAAIEQALMQEGFEIYHPQQHSIEHQLRTFRDATHLVGPDGSAFHLAGFIARPDQSFTIIKRRNAREYLTFYHQIIAAGAQVHVVDAVIADWIRPGKHKADDMSWGEVDPGRLSDGFLALGLIDNPLEIHADLADELAQIGRIHKGEMTRLDVAEDGVPAS